MGLDTSEQLRRGQMLYKPQRAIARWSMHKKGDQTVAFFTFVMAQTKTIEAGSNAPE